MFLQIVPHSHVISLVELIPLTKLWATLCSSLAWHLCCCFFRGVSWLMSEMSRRFIRTEFSHVVKILNKLIFFDCCCIHSVWGCSLFLAVGARYISTLWEVNLDGRVQLGENSKEVATVPQDDSFTCTTSKASWPSCIIEFCVFLSPRSSVTYTDDVRCFPNKSYVNLLQI